MVMAITKEQLERIREAVRIQKTKDIDKAALIRSNTEKFVKRLYEKFETPGTVNKWVPFTDYSNLDENLIMTILEQDGFEVTKGQPGLYVCLPEEE